jgi:VanZ family protein
MKNKKLFFRILIWLIWLALIFWMSHQDKEETTLKAGVLRWILDQLGIDGRQLMQGPYTLYIRKLAHITEYAILMILSLRIAILQWPYKKAALYSLLFCIFYAATDEFHQTFIPGRVGTPVDVGIDMLGMLLGLVAWSVFRRKSE